MTRRDYDNENLTMAQEEAIGRFNEASMELAEELGLDAEDFTSAVANEADEYVRLHLEDEDVA